MVERFVHIEDVGGSNPSSPTIPLPALPPIWLLRHGETDWNRLGRLQGSLDAPLTARGRVQAARAGAILRANGVGAPAWTSPQPRARRSAALAGLAATPDPRLREVGLGRWEGQHLAVIDPPPGLAWKFEAPDGESRAAVAARVAGFLQTLRGPAVVVTHGVTGIVLRALATGAADWDALEDRQGVVYHLADGRERVLR